MPCYRLRFIGQNVIAGDRVFLKPVILNQMSLNLNSSELYGEPGFKEAVVQSSNLSWKMCLYLSFNESLKGILKSGDILRLFHIEQQKFLTMDRIESSANNQLFLKCTNRVPPTTAKSAKALWEVEIVQYDPYRGAIGRWNSIYRFRHLSTGYYMIVELNSDGDYW